MRKQILLAKIFLPALIITTSISSYAQQKITITSSKENNLCNGACTVIDIPELNSNPNAIIIVTSIETVTSRFDIDHGSKNGSLGYSHPIAVYYLNNKWNIFHLDNAPVQPGIKFTVQYFMESGADRFVYVVPASGISSLDNANPNVPHSKSFLITETLSPPLHRSMVQNKSEVKVDLKSSGHVYLKNIDGTAPIAGSAYNIVLSSTVNAIDNPNSPTGNAGGDLADSYPSPTVVKLLGRPLSLIPPNVGQVLKWNGTEWAPANDSTCCTGTITPSDIRFKKNILPLENSLQKIMALDGFTYNWRADEFTDKGFDNSQQIGFIAQEVETVLPQLVHTGIDGYKGVDYTKLIPVMVEAIKEQQKQIDELKKIITQLLKH